jgi:hypothetical protein
MTVALTFNYLLRTLICASFKLPDMVEPTWLANTRFLSLDERQRLGVRSTGATFAKVEALTTCPTFTSTGTARQ